MFRSLLSTCFVLLFILVSLSPTIASIEVVEFENPAYEQRYRSLISELRCLKCQNQNLASSDAPLAKDLRIIATNMIKSGSSDTDIKNFMRKRYGDFVLYEPPFNAYTAFLWLGPFVLLIIVLGSIIISVRKRQEREKFAPAAVNNDSEERTKIRNLLRDTPNLNVQYDNDSK